MNNSPIQVRIATIADTGFSQLIADEMESSAKARGTGIAKRSIDYLSQKMVEGKAVIAFTSAKQIKQKIFELSRSIYPEAKIFGLTTGLAVMKINSDLGYEPVTYSELTQDDKFWEGCKSCVNFDILMSKERKNCLCTAMLYDPQDHYEPEETKKHFEEKASVYDRLLQSKRGKFLAPFVKSDKEGNPKKSFFTYLFNL